MEKYLVLHPFRSYGVYYSKGAIVDEDKIRSPYLRKAEGKIVLAVASAEIPTSDDEHIISVGALDEDDDIISVDSQIIDEDADEDDSVETTTVADDTQKIETKKPLFSFGGK